MKKQFGGYDLTLPYDFQMVGLAGRKLESGYDQWAAIIVDDLGFMRWLWLDRDFAIACKVTITGRTMQKFNGDVLCVKGRVDFANDDMVYGADEEHTGDCWLMVNIIHGQQLGAATVTEDGKYVLADVK